MGILADAVNNWPEDEAFCLFCDLIEGDDPAGQSQIDNAVAHMHAQFKREHDAAELIARFNRKLSELRKA